MWAKVTSAFKRNEADASSSVPQQQDVKGRPSNDESVSDSAGEHGGVPSSPSKKSKGGILRRGSRLLDKDNGASLSLAKRVKSSLHMNSNMNESNLTLNSTAKAEQGAQPVVGSVRSIFGKNRRPSAMQMQAAMSTSDDALNGEFEEAPRPSSPSPMPAIQAPGTPLDARQFGSVRSILRDKNTPGSGQNVRFFSRDAYRVISPNTSTIASTDNTESSGDATDAHPFMQRIQNMSPDRDGTSKETTRYLSASSSPNNMFSPVSAYASPNSGFSSQPTATSTPYLTPEASQAQAKMPAPPPQLAGIFDLAAAQEHGVRSIHASEGAALRDNAVEVNEFGRPVRRSSSPNSIGSKRTINSNTNTENRASSHSTASSMSIATPNSIINGSQTSFNRMSGGDETQYHSLGEDGGEKHTLSGRAASTLGLHKVFKKESSPVNFPGSGNTSSRVRALSERVFSRPSLDDPKNKADDGILPQNEPDPFSADASNYYNAAAGFPKTPPRIGHVRSDSVVSGASMNSGHSASVLSHGSGSNGSAIRTTRALGNNLEDRDETITVLRAQLAFHQELATQYEADIRARDAHAALMNQKLQAHEAEAERRAKAMRGMRKRVTELERAAAALEEQAERTALESFERHILDGASDDTLRALQNQMVELEMERNELEKKGRGAKVESERLMDELRRKEDTLMETKYRLETSNQFGQGVDKSAEEVHHELAKVQREAALAAEQHQEIQLAWAEDRARLVNELESVQKEIASKSNEITMLKSEVEAQWSNTERLNERADKLQKEKDDIDRGREHLKNEISALEKRISDMEVEWTESENRKTQLENELTGVLAEKQEIEKERDQLHQRLEKAGYSNNVDEVEQLRNECASMRRDHARMQTEHARSLSEAEVRASDAIELRNETARRQAAAEAEVKELREKMAKMQEENDKLKTNIQVLKHQSADQDVKILQLEKQHDQDTEDKLGLNIALDSKQQELELLKRSMGVRGTAGSTPAVPTRAGGRRDSAAFKTPIPLRPASSLSDGAKRTVSMSDTEKSSRVTIKPMLGKNARPVGTESSNPSTTVKKAPRPRLSDTSLSAPPGRVRSPTASSDTAKTPRPGVTAPTAASARRAVSPPSSAITARTRRASMTISGIANMSVSASSALSDKENETPRARPVDGTGAAKARRMSMQPLAVPA